jgi:ADP-heptose:LPS heptosyltransferase
VNKYLIVRFSSFGDICQALPVAAKIRELDPSAKIHWVTRKDFAALVQSYPQVDQVWTLDKSNGFSGLMKMIQDLKIMNYTHVYDAHANLRSLIVLLNLWWHNWNLKWIRRSKNRFLRILLFYFRIHLLPKPFRGAQSYLSPLRAWFSDVSVPAPLHLHLPDTALPLPQRYPIGEAVLLAPSANWELKRWPVEYWVQLIRQNPDIKFVILGGSQDQFCAEIANLGGPSSLNLAGKLTWIESMQIISKARLLISGDTGLLHFADIIGKKTIALIGPTAFGYPSRSSSYVLEVDLPCKPCTKDGNTRCRNSINKRCLREITPEKVSHTLNQCL